jgi:hypothetical protein
VGWVAVSQDRLVRAFIGALDLTPIAVFALSKNEPVLICAGGGVAGMAKRVSAMTDMPIEAKAVRWCAGGRDAKLIASTCNNELPQLGDGWLAVSAPIAIKAVELVAGDLGIIPLESDASVRSRAEATVRLVELELERLRTAGEFRSVTRAYREYRLARAAEGKGAQSWCAWFASYKAELVRAAARRAFPLIA